MPTENNVKKLEKIRKTLFGTSLEGVTSVLLTPVNYLYSFSAEYFQNEYVGWRRTGYFNKNTIIILCPTGKYAEDDVYYAPKVENILFLGFCGSCNPEIKVGDIFSAESAQWGSDIIRASNVIDGFKRGTIYQVETFHEQDDASFPTTLRDNGIDCVDMETYSVFMLARKKTKNFGGMYVVTDNLLTKPFYQTDSKDLTKIMISSKKIVEKALEEIINES